jgi:predicted RNA methylase
VFWKKFTDVSEVLTAYITIALTIEAVNTSETSITFDETTRLYIPEESDFHAWRRENLKFHLFDTR